jgi:hypothetical protein
LADLKNKQNNLADWKIIRPNRRFWFFRHVPSPGMTSDKKCTSGARQEQRSTMAGPAMVLVRPDLREKFVRLS